MIPYIYAILAATGAWNLGAWGGSANASHWHWAAVFACGLAAYVVHTFAKADAIRKLENGPN